MENIQLVTTEELIGELKRRCPDGLIVAMQFPEHEIRSSGYDWRMSFNGRIDVTLKLANIALWKHQQEIMGRAL